jgi:hypothetical protein
MRTLILLTVLAVASGSAHADPGPSVSPYPPLAPQAVDKANNAASIVRACQIAKEEIAKDPSKRAACVQAQYEFCEAPLALPLKPIPTHEQITALENKCPAVVAPASSRIETKALPTPDGASWQSELLSGLASFLVQRAKAEALATLIDHLKAEVCGHGAAGYMPTTCGLLASTAPYTDPVAWGTLKAAFETDLRALPEVLVGKLTRSDAAELLGAVAEAAALIERGKAPLEVIVGLKTKYASIRSLEQCSANPYPCALEVFGIVAEILVPTKESATRNDEEQRLLQLQVAARLLLRNAAALGISDDIIKDHLGSTLEALKVVRDALATLRNSIDPVALAVTAAATDRSPVKKAKARAAFVDYIRAAAAALKAAPIAVLIPAVQQKIDIAKLQGTIEHLTLAIDHARAGEYIQSFVELQAAMSVAGAPVPGWFGKYGGFIAEIAAAQSKEDVQRVLEAAAAPVGAWRKKRGSGHHTLTLNGYVGLQGGYEWLSGDDTNGSFQGGLFAPVGLEASYGFSKSWSIGVLLSVIDLGALVDVRSEGDMDSKVADTSTIGFRQVFSPGVYAVLGLGRAPFALGAGLSLVPELRSVDLAEGGSTGANALRFSVFFATDITIFGF